MYPANNQWERIISSCNIQISKGLCDSFLLQNIRDSLQSVEAPVKHRILNKDNRKAQNNKRQKEGIIFDGSPDKPMHEVDDQA